MNQAKKSNNIQSPKNCFIFCLSNQSLVHNFFGEVEIIGCKNTQLFSNKQ